MLLKSLKSLKLLKCEFEDSYSYKYLCEVKNDEFIISKNDRELLAVIGQHLKGKTNDDVKSFSCIKRPNFFPRGITIFLRTLNEF